MKDIDLDRIQEILVTAATDIGLKVLAAIAFWVIGRWLSGVALSIIRKGLEQQKLDPTITSMNSFVRKAYNLKLVEWLFEHLSKNAEFDLFHPDFNKVLDFGAIHSP